MSKTLTHDEAAKRGQYCDKCGLINYDAQPLVYTCPKCEEEGYECCFPAGKHTLCIQCEEAEGSS